MKPNYTVCWLWRRIDLALDYWFTVYLFWINKPVWKWIFLGIFILSLCASVEAESKEQRES